MRAILAGHIEGHNPDAARPGRCEYEHNVSMVDAVMRSAKRNLIPVVSHASRTALSPAERQHENDESITARIIECVHSRVTESIEVHHNIARGADANDYVVVMYDCARQVCLDFARHVADNIRPFLNSHGVQRVILAACGRGTEWGYYEAVCLPAHTALILECCFMSNASHGPLIDDPAVVQAYADLIGYAIGSYNG